MIKILDWTGENLHCFSDGTTFYPCFTPSTPCVMAENNITHHKIPIGIYAKAVDAATAFKLLIKDMERRDSVISIYNPTTCRGMTSNMSLYVKMDQLVDRALNIDITRKNEQSAVK
jgi:hypothetical protein